MNALVMGPWSHGGWGRGPGDRLGNLNFAVKTGEFFREQIQFPFFEKYLKDKPADLPEAYIHSLEVFASARPAGADARKIGEFR